MEAAGSGFRGITWERWQRENEIIRIFRIDVPTQQWQEGLGEFCDTLGSPYDTPRLFREAARHLTQGWTQQFSWGNPQKNANGVLCADAVAAFLHRIGFSQFEFPLRWTPGTLLDYANEEQAFVPMISRVRTIPFLPVSNENSKSEIIAIPTSGPPHLEIVS